MLVVFLGKSMEITENSKVAEMGNFVPIYNRKKFMIQYETQT